MHPLKHRHATLLTGLYNAFPVIDTQTNTLTCTHINGCMFGRGLVSGLRTQAPLKQLGIKLLTFQLVCDLLSLLRHSCPKKNTFCSFDSHCTKTYLLLLLKMKKTTFSLSSMTFSFLLTTDTERGLGRRVISGEKHDADGH